MLKRCGAVAKSPERKKLQRLTRVELLELLLAQTRETEMLRGKLEEANAALTDRYIHISEAGDLAHAVLAVNDIMESAQKAAQQYLDNIEAMKHETEVRCIRLIQEAKEEAERIRAAAMLDKDAVSGTPEEILNRLKEKVEQSGEDL